MSVRRNCSGRGRVGKPGRQAVGHRGFIPNKHFGMQRIKIVLANFGHSIVIEGVGAAYIFAVNIVDFDFKTMAGFASVINGIEIA